jgi:hypothetical protein
MWRYYKRTFLAVQLFAVLVSWMVYRSTKPMVGPPLVFFLFMQMSAVLGAFWAQRLGKKLQAWQAGCSVRNVNPSKGWKTR